MVRYNTTRQGVHDSARWVLPKRLTRAGVEEWLGELDPSTKEVAFHLAGTGCTTGPNGAESLQSAICLLQRRGVLTRLTFPETTFLDPERLLPLMAGSSSEGTPTEASGTPAERTFAYRLPGLMLAQLCESPRVHSTLEFVRKGQTETIRANRNLFGHGKFRSLVALGDDDPRTRVRPSDRDRQSMLENDVLQLLGISNYHPSKNRDMDEVTEFIYQAWENSFDHARKSLDGAPIKQVRTVSMERHIVGTGAGAVPITELAPDANSALRKYLVRAERNLQIRGRRSDAMHFWSFTIADGGVGVGARMHGSLEIYQHDLGQEYKLVQEAVLPGVTTKPVGLPGRGSGFTKMMRATWRLGGLFELRTGRLLLSRSYLTESGKSELGLDFNNRDNSAFDLAGQNNEQILTAGTVTSILLPALDLNGSPSSLRQRL